MADRVLFIGWNRMVAGREQQGMQLWQKAMEFYGKLQSNGSIESFEPVLLSAHRGDLNGFILLRGDAANLVRVQEDDAFLDLATEAEYCLEGFGIVTGYLGDRIKNQLLRWSKFFAD